MTTFRLTCSSFLVFASLVTASLARADEPKAPATCESLKDLALENVTITSAESVSAGSKFFWKGLFIGLPFFHQPASCRIAGSIHPTTDSDIRFELWMPVADAWNKKFQGLGNGGLAGSIDTLSLNAALQGGYAAVSTDTGHEASDLVGTWALGHPEKLTDYGYRAIHETTLAAKALIAAFYGEKPAYNYFGSCSNGGREALVEAQRYPEDYDGILVGAPAFDGTNNVRVTTWIQNQLLSDPANYLASYKLPAINDAAINACDANDGVKDGLIDDPRTCRFDHAILQCKAGDDATSPSCLTEPQLKSLRAIYEGPGGAIGDSVNHGFEFGGERSWARWITGPAPRQSIGYIFANEFHRYLIYSDPTWTFDRYDFAKDSAAAMEHMAPFYNATDPDLTPFINRGGKIIFYHGWDDYALQPRNTIDYFNRVKEKLGAEKAEQSTRLYMVPGMEHCFAGPGPNIFGQLPPGGSDASHNISKTLEEWVEKGKAPKEIIATKYDETFRPLIAPEKAKALRTRPLCPYPQVAKWNGTGNTDEASSFTCATP